MTAIAALLREPRWMTPERTRAYLAIFATVAVLAAAAWLALSRDNLDMTGKPVGTDFLSFYAASRLALAGAPAEAYRPPLHHAAEVAVIGRDTGYAAFFYPPPYLLACLGLAALPYLPALALWLAVTGAAYLAAMRRILGPVPGGALALLAFPATLSNAAHGQNGFLTAALFGGGILLLGPRPILAGLLFGGLVIKPQLGLVLPVALACLGAWRTMAATAVSGLGLAVASAAILGVASWDGFLAVSPLARAAMEQEWVGSAKMQSTFAALRLFGAGIGPAYLAQGLVTAGAMAGIAWLGRRRPDPVAYGAATAAATLLASPFLLDYDFTLLAIPLAWLLREGLRDGFRPWEQAVVAGAFLLPLAARLVATVAGLPLSPLVLGAVLATVLARAATPGITAPRARAAGAHASGKEALTGSC